jgi:phenylalanyl-tRNA synthetase beta chain
VCAYLNHNKGTAYEPLLPTQPDVVQLPISNISITISEPEACPRYTGISLSGVKVVDSPEWLKNRLQCIGLRSINNIVDITNYVLHEFGQPLHAFDADQIGGQQINVGLMPEGTAFVTLDEKERKLSASDLMICDGNGPVAIGGVFGGLHSGITEKTTNVFIESAYFTPAFIRRTSLHHGLRTDAATHFEKGVDMGMVLPALLRAASLMVQVAGATITSCVEDIYPNLIQPPTIKVAYAYIKKLSGKDYSPAAIKNILGSLGFTLVSETETHLEVLSPTSKTDITIPADIVEEILRIDGLDNVALSGRLEVALTSPQKSDRKERERVASLLCGAGLQEVMTNSIVNSKYYPDNTTLVHMINSLSTELDVMRPSMLESGLEVVAYNCNRKCNDLALFEFGNTYMDAGGKYIETPRLAIWITGNMRPASWDAKPEKASIYYLKGLVTNLMQHCGLTAATETSGEDGNGVVYKLRNQVLATIDQMTPAKLKEFDIKQDLWFANIHWDQWVKAINNVKVKHSRHCLVLAFVLICPFRVSCNHFFNDVRNAHTCFS